MNVNDAPLANVAEVHVTCWPLFEHDVPGGAAALTKLTPVGSVSTIDTPVAALGPLLVTVTGYCTVPPALTVVGEDDLVTDRSAIAVTGVLTTLPMNVKFLAIVRAR